MQSHQYDFLAKDVLKLIVPPGVFLGLASVALHCMTFGKLLPPPRPALDMDRTILLHQAEASRSRHSDDLILLGDSSCLMDIWAPRLGKTIARATLNLGTFSYIDLLTHGRLLKEFAATNPGQLKSVVLLMHPETLRQQEVSLFHNDFVRSIFEGQEPEEPGSATLHLDQWLGIEILKSRLLGRFMPWPLHGEYGAYYGFTSDLWRYLDQNKGSAVDPNRFDRRNARGNAEYRLAKKWENESRRFHEMVPLGVRLFVGLTPAPESFVSQDHAAICHRMLGQWGAWLQADEILTNLPSTFPDNLFASVTHLNRAGAQEFTELLAKELARLQTTSQR